MKVSKHLHPKLIGRGVPVALLALIGPFVLAGCEKKQAAAPQAPPPQTVTTAAVESRDVPVYLDEIGKCVAPEIVSVQPQVSGRVVEIHVKDGAELKKGDKLFNIDPRPFEAQLEQSKAELELSKASLDQNDAVLKQNQAQLESARSALEQTQSRQKLNLSEFERAKNLLANDAIPKQDYDVKEMATEIGEAQLKGAAAAVAVAEAQLKQSSAAIAMAKAHIGASASAVKTAELNLEYTNIVSPIDGRAGQRLVDVGNIVNSNNINNNSVMLIIQRIDPIYADFNVPESELGRVRKSMAAGALKVECRVPEDAEHPREGEVSFLDNSVLEGAGTVKLRALIPNTDHYFWPGQFVRIKLVLDTKKGAKLIPASATQISQTGPFVYVFKTTDKGSIADLRPVKLGLRYGDMTAIEDGLSAGENVILSGKMLYPGAMVALQPAQTAAISPAPTTAPTAPTPTAAGKTEAQAK